MRIDFDLNSCALIKTSFLCNHWKMFSKFHILNNLAAVFLLCMLPKKCDDLKLICVAAGNLLSSFEHYLHCKFRLSHLLHAIISTTGQEETPGGLHFGPCPRFLSLRWSYHSHPFRGVENEFRIRGQPPVLPRHSHTPSSPVIRQSKRSVSSLG